MKKVLFVCHGNICRSTMAESVFTHMVKNMDLEDEFEIDSAATSREEIGATVHRGTVKKLNELNIPVVPHRARQITKEDVKHYDYIIAMDGNNMRNLERMFGKNDKFKKLLSFAGDDRDIADPWYTGNFDETYDDINMGLRYFINSI